METIAIADNEAHCKYQYIAENLSSLLKSNNLNASQLAQILDIPMMTVRRLLSGETTDPRISTLKLIADYFGVTIDFLIKKDNFSANTNNFGKVRPFFVPKLNWEAVSKAASLSEINLATWKDWQSISLGEKERISSNAFALESRPSMFPRFPQGTLFIFDNEISPKDGDIVLIKLKNNNELTLRELVIDPPEWQLHPVVTGSNVLPYSKKEHEFVGVNILTMLFNRKDCG